MRRLHRIIGQPRRRAHDRPLEAVSPLLPGGIDPQLRGQAGPVGARHQRAQIVGQRLGQHRHDAVGEIDRVAAARRLAVERAAGGDVGADIGNGDDDVPAAGIGRIRIGLGPHRVVEIAGVAVVDRDQRELAQIGAAGRISEPRGGRLGQRGGRELARNVECGDHHRADRAGRIGRAEAFDDAGALAEAARRQRLGDHQLVIAKPGRIVAEDAVLALIAAIGRDDYPAVACPAEYADDAARRFVEAADDFGLDLARIAADQPCQGALAGCEFLAGRANEAKARRLAARLPGQRPGQGHAVGVAAEALDRHDFGERRSGGEFAVGRAHQFAGAPDPAQHIPQRRLLGRSQPKGAGNFARAKRARIVAQELDQRLGRGQGARGTARRFSRATAQSQLAWPGWPATTAPHSRRGSTPLSSPDANP